MTKSSLVILFLLINIVVCSSQNLVPNPSFEETKQALKRWSRDAGMFNASLVGWNSPTQGSPDLLNLNLLSEMSPPRPKVDLTPYKPRTGDFMVGIKTYGCNGRSRTLHCKEYVQIKLKEPLREGKNYYFEYWVLPISSSVKVNSFGLIAGEYETVKDSIYMEIDAYPLVEQEEVILSPDGQWQKISGEFEAAFDYEYIIAGIFNTDKKMKVIEENDGLNYGYYLLDDVLLKAVETSEKITFEVNEVLILENILFEFDKAVILNEAVDELDQLAEHLNTHPDLNIEIAGHTDDQGGDAHNKKLSKDRALAVKDYFVKNGIEESRMITFGHGSEFPRVANSDGINRAVNRRVELKLVE